MNFSPQTESSTNMAQIPPVCCPAIKAALRSFFWGRFSGRLPIGMVDFKTPEGGKRSPIFFWLLAGRNSLIFTPKRRGNAREFFFGRFFGRLPIGMVHFKTPEGGKLLSIFCWLLAGRNFQIFNP